LAVTRPVRRTSGRHAKSTDSIRSFLLGKDTATLGKFDFRGELEITKTYRAVEIASIDLAARYDGCALSD